MILSTLLLFAGSVAANNSTNSCSYNNGVSIKMYFNLLQTCAGHMGCIDYEDDNDNGRRRLADNDDNQLGLETYSCYCSNCNDYMEDLMEACNKCDVVNYCEEECNDDDNNNNNNNDNGDNQEQECQCVEQEGGLSFYQSYCMLNSLVVMNHADSFCNMLSTTSSDCLQEMEYMVNPPEEEEDDDDNNNNNGRRLRRRLNDNNNEEGMIDGRMLAGCWSSPFVGSTMDDEGNMLSLSYCAELCTLYANTTYSYMTEDVPAQTCGVEISYLEDEEESLTANVLPHPTRMQGVMCVSSACSSDDVTTISTYLMDMAKYAQFINFQGEENQNNNNNNNKNGDEEVEVTYMVPETQISWKCALNDDSDTSFEGYIENDAFPDECAGKNEDDEEEESDDDIIDVFTDSDTGPLVMVCIALGLCLVVSTGLAIYWYRQAAHLKAGAGGLNRNQDPASATYQGGGSNM